MDFNSLKNMAKKSDLFGNQNSGKAFDDNETHAQGNLGLPTGISVRRGSIIDKVTFIYDQKKLEHGGKGGSEQIFQLQKDERIISVEGTISKFGNIDTIQSLKFTTDKNHSFNVNRSNSNNKFKFEAEDGYAIYALHGRADQYVRGIGFYALNVKQLSETEEKNKNQTQEKAKDFLGTMMSGK